MTEPAQARPYQPPAEAVQVTWADTQRRVIPPADEWDLPKMPGPNTVTVQVTMTVEVESGEDALDVARGWLPGSHELPLSSSIGRILSVELRRAAG